MTCYEIAHSDKRWEKEKPILCRNYKAQYFINLEENLNTQFDNLVATNSNFGHSTGKDSHRQKDEFDRGMHG